MNPSRYSGRRYFLFLSLIIFNLTACALLPNPGNNDKELEILLKQADTYYSAQQYSQAKQIYLKALEFDDFLPLVYYRLGNISYAEKQFIEAQEYYLESIKLQPNSIKTHYNIANVYLRLAEFHLSFFRDNTGSRELSEKTEDLLSAIRDFSLHNSNDN